jgi:hypothetical protein
MWRRPLSSPSLCKPPKYVGLVQCGHLCHHHHHHHYVNHPSLLVSHCSRPTDFGGLHSDDDDDDDGGVHIVLDQQTLVVYIVMMMMMMPEPPLSSSSSLCKQPKPVGLVQCGHLRHHHHHHYVNHQSLLV